MMLTLSCCCSMEGVPSRMPSCAVVQFSLHDVDSVAVAYTCNLLHSKRVEGEGGDRGGGVYGGLLLCGVLHVHSLGFVGNFSLVRVSLVWPARPIPPLLVVCISFLVHPLSYSDAWYILCHTQLMLYWMSLFTLQILSSFTDTCLCLRRLKVS